MKKKKKMILLILGALSILTGIVLNQVEEKLGLTLFMFRLSTLEVVSLIYSLSAVFIGIVIISTILETGKNMIGFTFLYQLGAVVVILFVAAFILGRLFIGFSSEPRYFTFKSPDQNHSIVFRESSFLLAGGGVIYEKTGGPFMKSIGTYSTDDGYRPFSNNNYKVTWEDDGFILMVGEGIPGTEKIYFLK